MIKLSNIDFPMLKNDWLAYDNFSKSEVITSWSNNFQEEPVKQNVKWKDPIDHQKVNFQKKVHPKSPDIVTNTVVKVQDNPPAKDQSKEILPKNVENQLLDTGDNHYIGGMIDEAISQYEEAAFHTLLNSGENKNVNKTEDVNSKRCDPELNSTGQQAEAKDPDYPNYDHKPTPKFKLTHSETQKRLNQEHKMEQVAGADDYPDSVEEQQSLDLSREGIMEDINHDYFNNMIMKGSKLGISKNAHQSDTSESDNKHNEYENHNQVDLLEMDMSADKELSNRRTELLNLSEQYKSVRNVQQASRSQRDVKLGADYNVKVNDTSKEFELLHSDEYSSYKITLNDKTFLPQDEDSDDEDYGVHPAAIELLKHDVVEKKFMQALKSENKESYENL